MDGENNGSKPYENWWFGGFSKPYENWWLNPIMVPNPIKIDDLGGFPIMFGNTHISKGIWRTRDLY